MLNRVEGETHPDRAPEFAGQSSDRAIDFDHMLAAARRQAPMLIVAAILGLLLGLAYIVTALPLYTASTDLLIDSQKDKNDVSASIAELTFDTGAIDSQVEVLKSEKISLAVISALKLTSDPEFMGVRGSLIGQALGLLRTTFNFDRWFVTRDKSEDERTFDQQRAAMAQLKNNLDVRRVARTYVLSVDYTSPDASKAAAIANAFAEAYLSDQLDAKFDAARRATGWMQSRIAQLKSDAMASDSAVQKFKADNGLTTVNTGGAGGTNGATAGNDVLVSDQQMSGLNAELMLAHSETAKAEARYNQITDMLQSGKFDGAVTDSLDNPVVNDLRQKYLTASKSEAELENKLGAGHLQVIALKRDMAEYQRLIFEELKRIAESYRSEGEVARAKEDSLNSSLSLLVGQSAGANQTMVQLRELEREAETFRTLYQTFLQRYQETIQQQTFPIGEARVITVATRPSAPSFPKRGLILALSLVLGSMAGAGVGALREYRDRVFRTASQVREELGLEFLGMLQAVARPHAAIKASAGPRNPKEIVLKDLVLRYSIDHPLSGFSETLRTVKVAADLALHERKPKFIGIISVLPNEGKSTVAKNFASLLAHLGAKTLLIDGDLRNPGLSRAFASHAEAGLVEAIREERPLADVLMSEPESGLKFLPAVIKKRVQHTSEMLSSSGMNRVLQAAGDEFQYIVVDLPPIGPVVDVRAAASLFDGFIFVIEWGRTARTMVKTILAADEILYEKCIGVVFNKVQLSKIRLYESYASKDYYYGRYRKYYRQGNAADKELV